MFARATTMTGFELDHVQLTVPKAREADVIGFYADALDLTRIPKPVAFQKNGGAWFQIGVSQLHIGVEELGIASNRDSKRHICLRVNDLEALRHRLQGQGVAIIPDMQP